MDSKKAIPKFDEFCKGRKKVNESQIAIDIEWKEKAIAEVLEELKDETYGTGLYDDVLKFVKTKNSILDISKDDDRNDTDLIKRHIKEIIYLRHWDSFFTKDGYYYPEGPAMIHTFALAIDDVAQTVLDKIQERSNNMECQEGPTKLKLEDSECGDDLEDEELCDELCDDNTCYEMSNIKTFRQFNEVLNEAIMQMKCDNYSDLVSATLKAIETEAGSLVFDDVMAVVKQNDTEGQADSIDALRQYVSGKAMQQIEQASLNSKLWVKGIEPGKRDTEIFVRKALDCLCDDVKSEVLDTIVNTTLGRKNEKAK